MRPRKALNENTSFQESRPYIPEIDFKSDVAMVYGLDDTFESRLAAWKNAGYRVHVMTGVAWGHYEDYIRGQWDGQIHRDDAQMAAGNFPLEHGVKQGDDIYYMVPTHAYAAYLAEQLKRVVDAGALAIHLEEPEFWVRAGYSPAFQAEWEAYYGEPWQDPASSVTARTHCEQLKRHLYTRALDTLMHSLKDYAAEQGRADFRCYVPTHSLLNYTHWRIVSPESALVDLDSCDGVIAQVWTGTARTANVYRGVRRERTFETAYCEYAASAAMIRGQDFRLWLLSDPIEDNPNYAWSDYRLNWECTVTASLFFPETSRFEVTPWPTRVFKRTYPKENLRDKPLAPMLAAYEATLEAVGDTQLLADTRAAFEAFLNFAAAARQQDKPVETLGFATLSDAASEQLTFSDVLALSFPFYQHLSATVSPDQDQRFRDALARFYHNPPVEREFIPPAYATELQVVFNALADMDWPEAMVEWPVAPAQRIGLAVADTMMYQRGDPDPSDPDLSFVYGLALPLIKQGVPVTMVQMERMSDSGYMDEDLDVLLLTYEGMKPPSPQVHAALARWVHAGGKLVLFGQGDTYDAAQDWWNTEDYAYAHPGDHLLEMLNVDAVAGLHACGAGQVLLVPDSPSALAHQTDGASRVWAWLNQLVTLKPGNTLILRRGPYVIAAGLDETESEEPFVLRGTYVDLYDAALPVHTDPIIAPGTRSLWVDVARADPGHAWVLAASGRVDAEQFTDTTLDCTISGAAHTTMVMRALLPRAPQSVVAGESELTYTWDVASRTLQVSASADPSGLHAQIRF